MSCLLGLLLVGGAVAAELGLFRRPPPTAEPAAALLAHGGRCRFFNAGNLSDSAWLTDVAYDDSAWLAASMPLGNSTALVLTTIRTVQPPASVNYIRIKFTLDETQVRRARTYGMRLQLATLLNPTRLSFNGAALESGLRTALREPGALYWNSELVLDGAPLVGENLIALEHARYDPDPLVFFVDVQLLIDLQLVPLSSFFSITLPVPSDKAWHRPGYLEMGARDASVWNRVVMPIGYDVDSANTFARFGTMLSPSTSLSVAARRNFTLSASRAALFDAWTVSVVSEDRTEVLIDGELKLVTNRDNLAGQQAAFWNGQFTMDLAAGEHVVALEASNFHPPNFSLAVVIEGRPKVKVWETLVVSASSPATLTGAGNTSAVGAEPTIDLPLVVGVSVGATLFLAAVIALAVVLYQRAGAEPAASGGGSTLSSMPEMTSAREAHSIAGTAAQHRDYGQLSLTQPPPYDSAPSEKNQYDLIPAAQASDIRSSMAGYAAPPMSPQSSQANVQV